MFDYRRRSEILDITKFITSCDFAKYPIAGKIYSARPSIGAYPCVRRAAKAFPFLVVLNFAAVAECSKPFQCRPHPQVALDLVRYPKKFELDHSRLADYNRNLCAGFLGYRPATGGGRHGTGDDWCNERGCWFVITPPSMPRWPRPAESFRTAGVNERRKADRLHRRWKPDSSRKTHHPSVCVELRFVERETVDGDVVECSGAPGDDGEDRAGGPMTWCWARNPVLYDEVTSSMHRPFFSLCLSGSGWWWFEVALGRRDVVLLGFGSRRCGEVCELCGTLLSAPWCVPQPRREPPGRRADGWGGVRGPLVVVRRWCDWVEWGARGVVASWGLVRGWMRMRRVLVGRGRRAMAHWMAGAREEGGRWRRGPTRLRGSATRRRMADCVKAAGM